MSDVISAFPEALKKDSYKWSWEARDAEPTVYDKIFEVRKVDSLYDKATSALGGGIPQEIGEGEPIPVVTQKEGYTCYGKVRRVAKRVVVSNELQTDVQKVANFVKSNMKQWVKDAVVAKETFFANVINYGGYTAGHDVFNANITGVLATGLGNLPYDGKPLFALSGNNHPAKDGSTYYNSQVLGISKTNLQTAYNLFRITNNRQEDGTRFANKPDILLCSPSLSFTVDELLGSPDDPSTGNRARNVLHNIVKPVYWDYLTDADQWTLMKTGFGIVALERSQPTFNLWIDPLTEQTCFSMVERYGVMVENWRGTASFNCSTS